MFCPNAAAGLAVCEEDFFDRSQFIFVEYMHSTGGLGCPGSNTRMSYYSMTGLPDMVWDGTDHSGGGGADVVDGLSFRNIAHDHLAVDSPLSVVVTDVDFEGSEPSITVKIEIFEELSSITGTYLRVGVCETDVTYSGDHYHNVLRDLLADVPLTIREVGEIQEVTLPLTIDGTWDVPELWAFALVQRDSDKTIYNAGSTFITPYTVNVATDGGQSIFIDDSHTFGNTAVTHTGNAPTHTVDISLDTSSLPDGWDAHFTLDGMDLTSTTVTLEPYHAANLNVVMVPGPQGYCGRVTLDIHSHSGEVEDVAVPFVGNRPGADVMIVAHDGIGAYGTDFYGPAIEAVGRSYSLWDRVGTAIDAAIMQNYAAVIWYSGDGGPAFRESDRNEVEAYLESGGHMLFSGQNLATNIVEQGGSSWMINALRTFFQSSAESGPLVTGVEGDPVSDGLSLDLQGGDGAGNYIDTDVVTAFSGSEQVFTYPDTDRGAGVRAEYNGYKHLFLGFGFESINSAADREALMDRVLEYLLGPVTPVESGLPTVTALHQNLPNPFNPQTTIAFDLPGQMAVSLSVYDVSGRLVDVLLDNEVGQQGRNEVIWRGDDASGRTLPSGTYFYRLEGDKISATKRMTLVK